MRERWAITKNWNERIFNINRITHYDFLLPRKEYLSQAFAKFNIFTTTRFIELHKSCDLHQRRAQNEQQHTVYRVDETKIYQDLFLNLTTYFPIVPYIIYTFSK